MAINPRHLPLLDLARAGLAAPRTMCLAYPDILVTPEAIEDRYGLRDLPTRTDSAKIAAWHGLAQDRKIVETDAFFRALGMMPEYIDIVAARGVETVVDLNEPLPATVDQNTYDLVIDTGTLEHCFNVGTAFRSMCALPRVGGRILTVAPVTMTNHGFWCFGTEAYFAAFRANGYEVLRLEVWSQHDENVIQAQQAHMRFHLPPECAAVCVAERRELRPWVWPVQRKYGGVY